MKSTLLHRHQGLRTFALVLGHGDEAMASLTAFASDERLTASHFTAIGAFSRAVVAYFDWTSKQYRNIAVDEQVEVLSLAGDVALDRGRPKVHAHAVLGKADASTRGGHLVEGHVRPTLEIVITETPAHLQRRYDAESGLALIDPAASSGATLGRGDLVPHFAVATVEDGRVRYDEIWQHRNLVFVSLDPALRPEQREYVSQLLARRADFDSADTALVVSRTPVPGFPSPGIVVADRWGEIFYAGDGANGGPMPDADDLLDWVNFVRMQCPECSPR